MKGDFIEYQIIYPSFIKKKTGKWRVEKVRQIFGEKREKERDRQIERYNIYIYIERER